MDIAPNEYFERRKTYFDDINGLLDDGMLNKDDDEEAKYEALIEKEV